MKNYKLFSFVFILSLILIGFGVKSASAYDSGCMTGDAFSRTTGQSCGTTAVSTDCAAGDLFSHLTGQPCSATTTSSTPTLQIGSRGDAVKAFQQLLANAGFLTGKIDGIYGKMTSAAATNYYRIHPCPLTSGAGGVASSNCGRLPITPITITTTDVSLNVYNQLNNLTTWTIKNNQSDWLLQMLEPNQMTKYSKTNIVAMYKTFNENGTTTTTATDENTFADSVKTLLANNGWTLRASPTEGSAYSAYLYENNNQPLILTIGTRDAVTGGMFVSVQLNLSSTVTPPTTTPNSSITIFPTSGPVGTTVTLSGNFSVCTTTDPSECTTDRFNQLVFIQNGIVTPVNYISSPARTIQIPNSFSPGTYQLAMQNCLGQGCQTYNLATFTVTPGTATSQPPVWGAVSGPSATQPLLVNQLGTWNMVASSPTGGTLSYSADWKDSTPVVVQQSPIFTHSYSQVGTYSPMFTVTNNAGQTAQTGMFLCVESGPTATSCK